MAPSPRVSRQDGTTKPNQPPAGVNGRIMATSKAPSDEAASHGLGRSRQRSTVGADDEDHQYLRRHRLKEPAGLEFGCGGMEQEEKPAKVSMSNSEESGPMIAADRTSVFMSHTCGRATASGRTESNGTCSTDPCKSLRPRDRSCAIPAV